MSNATLESPEARVVTEIIGQVFGSIVVAEARYEFADDYPTG